MLQSTTLVVFVLLMLPPACDEAVCGVTDREKEKTKMVHKIAAGEAGMFCGWPANNGVWTWNGGKEILVGFSFGKFIEQSGHNIDSGGGILSRLARSNDGGRTWKVEAPANFVGEGGEAKPSPGGIAFDAPGFAMRIVGNGYLESSDPNGSFLISSDRGKTWSGRFQFGTLMEDPNLNDMEFTSRTSYLVTGRKSCLIFMSARPKVNSGVRDKSFVTETTDGGKTFHFVSWIVPLNDPHRAVMPSVVKKSDGTIIAALRRRSMDKDVNWVDCYASRDKGRTWSFLSRVGETGTHNGNPPALTALKDGRLACAYGDRTRVKLYARLSSDGGKTWADEIVVRDDFQPDKFDDKDFGYPRLVQNDKGELVTMYYWATKDRLNHQIAATIFRP